MKAIFNKFKKDDTGASSVIEMTLIFPLVLFVMGFLIYMGSYVMQSVTIYNDAQRIAVAASREAGIPGYENLYQGAGVTSKADFNWPDNSAPAISVINALMSEHDPYRYWGSGFLDSSEISTLETNLERLVADNSFLASSNVDCTITTSNNILSQQVQVRVVKYISAPQLFQALGLADNISIDVTATAVVGDPAEFIRNTDMVFDLTEYMMDNLKIGSSGQTINQKIAIYKQKFSDVSAKLGLSW
jgi:Flp pilus assembly pilin Flp